MQKKSTSEGWATRFRKLFPTRKDCSNSKDHAHYCQGCIDIIVAEDEEIEDFISQEIKNAKREVLEEK